MTAEVSIGERLALAAADMIDVPFRLHGRDPEHGLDCVGLVSASLASIGLKATTPSGYRLRNASIDTWLGYAEEAGFLPTDGPVITGDLMLVEPGPAQQHLMIARTGHHVIHAHRGVGRVVCQPITPELDLLRHWRLKD